MTTNNLKPRLLTTQKVLKKIRAETASYSRRVMQLGVLKTQLERAEEELLQRLYPEEDIIHIPSKFHNIEEMKLNHVVERLENLSLEELEDIVRYSKTPK